MLAAILSSKGNIVLFVKVEQVYHKLVIAYAAEDGGLSDELVSSSKVYLRMFTCVRQAIE